MGLVEREEERMPRTSVWIMPFCKIISILREGGKEAYITEIEDVCDKQWSLWYKQQGEWQDGYDSSLAKTDTNLCKHLSVRMWAGKGMGGASRSSKNSERGREPDRGTGENEMLVHFFVIAKKENIWRIWTWYLRVLFVLLWADKVSDCRLNDLNSRHFYLTDLGSGSLRSGC